MLTDLAQRWSDRQARYRPAGECIQPQHYEVAAIADDTTARAFVCRHHYSGSYPAARYRVGLYARGGALAGVAVFSMPANEAALAVLPGERLARVELGRFVLAEHVPGNGESWFLARCFELLRSRGIEGVLAFSDPQPRSAADGRTIFAGHIGTIYQATNAVFLGRSTGRTLRLLPDGRVMSDRAIQKIRAGERGWRYAVDQLVDAGAPAPDGDRRAWLLQALRLVTRPQRHPGNFRYAWALHARDRGRLPASLAYPKVAVPQASLDFAEAA